MCLNTNYMTAQHLRSFFTLLQTVFYEICSAKIKHHIVGSQNVITLKHHNVETRAFLLSVLPWFWLASEDWL